MNVISSNLMNYVGSGIISAVLLLNLFMIVFFIFKAKRTSLFYSFMLINVLLLMWLIFQIAELNIPKIMNNMLFLSANLIPYCFIGASWLMFCLEYSGNRTFSKIHAKIFIFLVPAVIYVIGITNTQHNLYYKLTPEGEWDHIYGPFFWVNLYISYFYVLFGDIVLLKSAVKANTNIKKQAALLIGASVIPLIANMFYVFGLIRPAFDLTSVSLAIPLTVFAFANYRYEFMDIIPSAFRKIIESVGYGIIVIDSKNRVKFVNNSLGEILEGVEEITINMHCDELINILIRNPKIKVIKDEYFKEVFNIEHHQANKVEHHQTNKVEFRYDEKDLLLKVHEISSFKGGVIGKIVVISDISDYKETQRQLEQYAVLSSKLAIENERIRFARDIHDTVGHSMTMIISLLEVAKIQVAKNPEDAISKLELAISSAKESHGELRKSVRGLKSSAELGLPITRRLTMLVERYKVPETNIEFSYTGLDNEESAILHEDVDETIFRACQEAITNSVRHGKATSINIILNFEPEKVRLFIIDNGKGVGKLRKGFGLKAMEDRVTSCGGQINVGSDGESGFNIRIEIPIGQET